MKKKATYNVFGSKKQGYRIAVPTDKLKSDRYECIPFCDLSVDIPLPEGTLVYVPVEGVKS